MPECACCLVECRLLLHFYEVYILWMIKNHPVGDVTNIPYGILVYQNSKTKYLFTGLRYTGLVNIPFCAA